MNLERLTNLTEEEKAGEKSALLCRHCNPPRERADMPYLKDELTDAIAQAIIPSSNAEEQKRFSRLLYTAVNKEPLKRVNYGIRSTGELPYNFLSSLTKWETVYFFRGRWEIKELDLDEPVEVITARHVLEGLQKLYQDHYVRKARGEYKSQLELPEDKQVREQCRQILRNYEETLGQDAENARNERLRQYREEREKAERSKPKQGTLF